MKLELEKIHSMKRIFRLKKYTLFLSSIMVILILFTGSVNAYERPAFKDGLASDWHPGSFCIPCHYTIAGDEKAKSISTGCQCHKIASKKPETRIIDFGMVLDIHTDMVCIKCHVGKDKNVNNLEASDFHRVMSRVACMKCHTIVDGNIQKPRAKICSDCHGADPHIVHGKKLEQLCMACHGEFGEKFTNKSVDPSQKMRLPSTLKESLENKEIESEEITSLGEFISNILSSIKRSLE